MSSPLADKIRPKTLDDVVGQKHILGEGKPLRKIIGSKKIPNMIFYASSMKYYNQIKLECMNICYACIDRDIVGNIFIDYETSFSQAFTYDYPRCSQLEKAIWCFTLTIRLARCGMLMAKGGVLEEETRKFVKKIHSLSKCEKDTLPPELFTDLLEVEEYLNWLDKKRNT